MNPPAPRHSVRVSREPVSLPTYEPAAPERHPMFLEKRVYQGSCGRVYPLPFTDRIAEKRVVHAWDAVTLENDFIRVVILPELGGRIHVGQDRTNGYDFFYRQEVIKPALVGLAGPWSLACFAGPWLVSSFAETDNSGPCSLGLFTRRETG